MGDSMTKVDPFMSRFLVGACAALFPLSALAQPAPAAPPPGAAPAPAPVAPAPVAPAPAPAAPPAAAPPAAAPAPVEPAPAPVEPAPMETAPIAPVAAEAAAPPPAEEPAPEFKVTTGGGVRAGLRIQNPNDPEKMNDQFFDELSAEIRLSGKIHQYVGWTLNVAGDGRTPTLGGPPGPYSLDVRVLDAIAQLDVIDEFHVWLGRMLTPSDRSNYSGPWFLNAWNYPGLYAPVPGAYIGVRGTEEAGREVGGQIWGDIGKGKFKYYAAVMDLDSNAGDANPAVQKPLYAARVQYNVIGSEPGFYGASTYYGAQDVVSIGAAVQQQADYIGPLGQDDIFGFNADLLAEFNTGSGTVTGEAAFAMTGDNDAMVFKNAWFLNASYLTPTEVGIGKIQPQVRFQQAMLNDPDESSVSAFEVFVNYIIKDYFAKISLGYTRGMGDSPATFDPETMEVVPGAEIKTNMVQLGFQVQQ
jgi:hypothetical protein